MPFTYESPYLDLELYRLLTILAASEGLAEYTMPSGGRDYERIKRLRKWEKTEVSRIVLSIAVVLRNGIQADPDRYKGNSPPEEGMDRIVGSFFPQDKPRTTPSPSGSGGVKISSGEPLSFRNALDRVIHAKRVAHAWEAQNEDPEDPRDVFPLGILTLFGDFNGKRPWEADVILPEYTLAAAAVIPQQLRQETE